MQYQTGELVYCHSMNRWGIVTYAFQCEPKVVVQAAFPLQKRYLPTDSMHYTTDVVSVAEFWKQCYRMYQSKEGQ